MKTNNNIKDRINDTLNSVDTISNVTISPFFKDKVLQHLFTKKEEKISRVWSWFTPQFQLATLMVFVVLNVFAITQLDSNAFSDEIDEFAQTYNLSSTEYQSIFN